MLKSLAFKLTRDVRRQSPAILLGRRTFARGFERRLRQRWRKGLNLLELLLCLCLDEGGTFNQRHRPVATINSDFVFDALVRLHARGCQITSEVLALLKTGHPDGANARWRSLHETAVTARFIAKHGNGTAERFLLHEGIKVYEDAPSYQEHAERLNCEAFSEREMRDKEALYKALLEKFGDDYKGGYGWASHALRGLDPPHKGSISFFHIEKSVGVPHFQPYYRMASHSIHADAKSIRFSLGIITPSLLIPAGPSNAGLASPGQNTAISLASLTATLLSHRVTGQPTIEDAAEDGAVMLTIQTFVQECCLAWVAADERLHADEDRDRRRFRKKTKPDNQT